MSVYLNDKRKKQAAKYQALILIMIRVIEAEH